MSLDNAIIDFDKAELASMEFALVAASYNGDRVERLLYLVQNRLVQAGASTERISVHRVPGSMELPFAVSRIAQRKSYSAIIALGIVIAGDTNHHEVIGDSTASALHGIAIEHGIPVINGILVVNNEQQADDRLGGAVDRGAEFADAAIAMASFVRRLNDE